MTWNLCAPCRTGSSEYAAEIARHRPGVLGVQEACSFSLSRTLRRIETVHGLRYHVVRAPMRRNLRCGLLVLANFGDVLLSRTPITDAEIVHFSQRDSERRGYLSAITTING